MPNTPVDTDDNDFVLKHRIAGAAFLLFFGALVLPWLLGAPTDAKKIEPTGVAQQPQSTEKYVPEDLENEVLTQLKDEASADEKVYISKVTPAGFTQVNESSVNSDDDKKAEAQKLAKEKSEQEKVVKATADKATQEKAAKLAKADQDKKAEDNKTEQAEREKQKQATLAKAEAKEKADTKTAKDAKAEQAAKKAAESTNSIKSGWIVQVGVFTDKSGADKISKSLSDNGFKTSSTTVDTNKGPGTGTRVWLGPFSDRAEATTAKTSLADKTSTSGFIRAYP